jgi:ribosome-binding factor A
MAHKSYSRISRVNHLVQEVIAETLEEIDDDDLEMVTVTGCDVAPDLRHAKVFISTLGDNARRDKALEALDAHKGEIKRAMSASIRMKFLPDLHFMADPSVDAGWKIEAVLKDVKSREGSPAVRADGIESE